MESKEWKGFKKVIMNLNLVESCWKSRWTLLRMGGSSALTQRRCSIPLSRAGLTKLCSLSQWHMLSRKGMVCALHPYQPKLLLDFWSSEEARSQNPASCWWLHPRSSSSWSCWAQELSGSCWAGNKSFTFFFSFFFSIWQLYINTCRFGLLHPCKLKTTLLRQGRQLPMTTRMWLQTNSPCCSDTWKPSLKSLHCL